MLISPVQDAIRSILALPTARSGPPVLTTTLGWLLIRTLTLSHSAIPSSFVRMATGPLNCTLPLEHFNDCKHGTTTPRPVLLLERIVMLAEKLSRGGGEVYGYASSSNRRRLLC